MALLNIVWIPDSVAWEVDLSGMTDNHKARQSNMKSFHILIIILAILTAGCTGQKIDIAYSNDLISINGTINDIANIATDSETRTFVRANIEIANQDSVAVIVDLKKLELSIDSLKSAEIFYDKPDSAIDKLIYIKTGKKYIAEVYWTFDSRIKSDRIQTAVLKMD